MNIGLIGDSGDMYQIHTNCRNHKLGVETENKEEENCTGGRSQARLKSVKPSFIFLGNSIITSMGESNRNMKLIAEVQKLNNSKENKTKWQRLSSIVEENGRRAPD